MRYLILLLLLTSCSHEYLAVFTDVISYENLASYHIDTPDPELFCPSYGQRLHISWSVPCPCPANLIINARIRFTNLQEVEWVIPVTEPRGRVTHEILNEDYDTTGGVLTYKVDLLEGDTLLEEQRHALWTELILF